MATIVNGALSGAAAAAATPGKLLAGLSHLAFIESQEADRDRLSDVNWWTGACTIPSASLTAQTSSACAPRQSARSMSRSASLPSSARSLQQRASFTASRSASCVAHLQRR